MVQPFRSKWAIHPFWHVALIYQVSSKAMTANGHPDALLAQGASHTVHFFLFLLWYQSSSFQTSIPNPWRKYTLAFHLKNICFVLPLCGDGDQALPSPVADIHCKHYSTSKLQSSQNEFFFFQKASCLQAFRFLRGARVPYLANAPLQLFCPLPRRWWRPFNRLRCVGAFVVVWISKPHFTPKDEVL